MAEKQKLNSWDKDRGRLLIELEDPIVQYAARQLLRLNGWVRAEEVASGKVKPPPGWRDDRALLMARLKMRGKVVPPKVPAPSKAPEPLEPALVTFRVPADGISAGLIQQSAEACGLAPNVFLRQLLVVALLQRGERLGFFPAPMGHAKSKGTQPLPPDIAKGLGQI